ncbi:unnamed protein product [Meganyctiphanes norvegica]|uniref:Uncharacterized protein n=1 Tax=Meganyctiphanes norvegica TaxID=48144 RepID=A0AAV2QND6_MEGNR
MKSVIAVPISLMFIVVATTARPADDDIEDNKNQNLHEPLCIPVDLLVELPITRPDSFHKLSTTHAYVRRCIGINNEEKACVPKNSLIQMEHGIVIKDMGSAKKESIRVSWESHVDCEYQKRKITNCSIDEARKCHKESTTHYYDEINCKCTCIVQIDGEETCRAHKLELSC